MDEHKYLQSKDDNLIFLTSALSPMQKTLKMNGLRPIFSQLFILVSKIRNEVPNQAFLENIFPKTIENQEFYDFFCEMVGIKQHNWIINFPIPRDQPASQNQQKEKNKQRKKVRQLIQINNSSIVDFQPCSYVNQPNQSNDSSYRRQSNHSISSSYNSQNRWPSSPIQLKPMIIVLEDFHLYDHDSDSIIKNLIHYYSRLCFFATVRDQYNEVQRKFEQSKAKSQDQVFADGLNSIEDAIIDDYVIIDLKPLRKSENLDELRSLMKLHFNIDQFVFEKMQIDRNQTLEDLPDFKQKQHDHLLFFENKPHLLTNNNANLLVLPYFYLRTMGNPLTCINFIDNLIKVKYLQYQEKNPTTCIVSEAFRQALISEETLNIEAPACWVQVNGPIIDSLSCLESLVLKFASVAGDIFDIQTLNKIQPFKESLSSEKLIKILQDLDAQDAIEVLDISEFNIYYRFTHPFMREVLYQRMTYNHRRVLHRAVAEALQTMNYPFGDLIEQKKLEFHWQQAEQRWNQTQLQEKFSHKAKRSIIVKQIQQVLSQAKNETFALIKHGNLEKKSDSNISWADRFILLTSRDLRYYYTDQDFKNNIEPLGTIQLKHIFGIYPLNQKEKGNKSYAFQMQASCWIKKSQEMPLRTFFFAAKTEEMLEEWSIYLEFSRAKAIYDEFVNNFGKISFPLGQSSENYDQNIRVDQAKPKKIDFGWGQSNETGNTNKIANLSRRASRASKAFQAGHKFNNKTSNVEDIQSQVLNQASLQSDLSNLKILLRTFLRVSTLVLYAHLFEMTAYNESHDESYKTLGQQLKVMSIKKEFFAVKQGDTEDDLQYNSRKSRIIFPSASVISDSDESFSPPTNIQYDQASLTSRGRKSSIMPIMESIKEEEETQQKFTENYVSDAQNERKFPNTFLKILTQKSEKQIVPVPIPVSSVTTVNPLINVSTTESKKQMSHIEDEEMNSSKKKVAVKFSASFNIPTEESILQNEKLAESKKIIKEQKKSDEISLVGYALRDCTSQKGYQFFVQKGEKVTIKKIYQSKNYLKCSYKGMTGILKKTDIAYQNSNNPSTINANNKFPTQFQVAKIPKVDLKASQQADLDKILSQLQPITDLPVQKYYY